MTIIDTAWLTSLEVARALALSKTRVHKLDDVLQPVRDRLGARRYDPARVAQVAAERAQRAAQRARRDVPAPGAEPSAEGATNQP